MVQFRLNKSPSNYSSTWLCLVIGNGDLYSSTDILFGAPIYAFQFFFFFFFFFFFGFPIFSALVLVLSASIMHTVVRSN